MSSPIYFATTNEGKIATMRNNVSHEIKIISTDLEIIEPQADTVAEIVKIKGDSAFKKLQKPVIVQDSGFVIPALNNFPGPYIKYILDSIGIEGILKLMEGVTDRSCYFIGCCCYTDQYEQRIFTFNEASGTLSQDIRGTIDKDSWGALWHVYIPTWSEGKTYSELSIETINDSLKAMAAKTDFEQLAEFLEQKTF